MKYIRFNDTVLDANLFMQLQDLSSVLSGIPDITFEYNFGSYIDLLNKKITASHFWDNREENNKVLGLKTDVYLRAIGTLQYSSLKDLEIYAKVIQNCKIPVFATQLFTLLEDLRIEELIKRDRPGTKRTFEVRKNQYKQHFDGQLFANMTRGYALDELFCMIYLSLQSSVADPVFPRANSNQLDNLSLIKPYFYDFFEAKTTQDIVRISEKIVFALDETYNDCMNQYFIFPIPASTLNQYKRNTLFDELKRKDGLVNEDSEETQEDKAEYIDEKFSTWHRESKNGDTNNTFLQFELESGTKTSLMGDGARESEEGDQAMASVQGSSGKSDNNDYSQLESLSKKDTQQKSGNNHPYGEDNQEAVKIIKTASLPSIDDEMIYKEFVLEIEPHKRKLANTIEKSLENKKTAQRKDLLFGRLSSKRLLSLTMENNARVFYKKNQSSNEIDAVFTLLVDCSASMNNKMDETKKGIVLFHEVLKKLQIPHSIVGFWEDANDVKEGYQPNYFHVINSYTESFQRNTGPKIMQLEPQEDNRDGFSIRVTAEEMEKRREKNKFLLVFSDGEPAASNYDQNGIVDTYNAVLNARKKGIEVIGMFLADGKIEENEELMMKNIYGKERLMIPSAFELPELFAPLLKKLILKTI